MPNSGGFGEWVKQIDGEPMPFRYGLKSICEHPAFASKKSQCEAAHKTFCTGHLAKASEEPINCDPAAKVECTWDMDCLPHHSCTPEGTCEEAPVCNVEMYANPGFGGTKKVLGPVYYTDAPMGKVIDWPDNDDLDSVKVSAGCAEVILMDADSGGCLEKRYDNIILGAKSGAYENSNLPYDLEDDVCAVKLTAKKAM